MALILGELDRECCGRTAPAWIVTGDVQRRACDLVGPLEVPGGGVQPGPFEQELIAAFKPSSDDD